MAMNKGFAVSDAAPHEAADDAAALAAQLRSARLTVAYGAPGAGRKVLAAGAAVMPLLHRRADDRPAVGDALLAVTAKVIEFSDRRRSHAARGMVRAELALRFDAWHGDALAELQAAVYAAAGVPEAERLPVGTRLAVQLARLQQRLGVRFLIVLDRFEEVLKGAVQPDDPKRMRDIAEQVFEAADRLLLASNFLLCVSDDAEPWFAKVRNPIEGFDDRIVRLPLAPAPATPAATKPPPPAAPAPAAAAPSVLKPDFAARAAAPRKASPVPAPAPEPAASVAATAPETSAAPSIVIRSALPPRPATTSPPLPVAEPTAAAPVSAAKAPPLRTPAIPSKPAAPAPAVPSLLERAFERFAPLAGSKREAAPAAPRMPLQPPEPGPAPARSTSTGTEALAPAAPVPAAQPAELRALSKEPLPVLPIEPLSAPSSKALLAPSNEPMATLPNEPMAAPSVEPLPAAPKEERQLAPPNEPPSLRSEAPLSVPLNELDSKGPASSEPTPSAPLSPAPQIGARPPQPEAPVAAAQRPRPIKTVDDTPADRVGPPEAGAIARTAESPAGPRPVPSSFLERQAAATEAHAAPPPSRIESAMSLVRGAASVIGDAKPVPAERVAPAASPLPPIGTMRLTSVRLPDAPAASVPLPGNVPAVPPAAPSAAATVAAASPQLKLVAAPLATIDPARAPLPMAPAAVPAGPPHVPLRVWAAGGALLLAAGGAAWWYSTGASNDPAADTGSRTTRSAQVLPPSAQRAAPPAPTHAPAAVDPTPAPATALATAPATRPAIAAPVVAEALMRVDADEPDEAMARELTRGLAAAGMSVAVSPAVAWTDLLAPASAGMSAEPRFAIARYDALQAARGPARDAVQIVTPLYTEEIFFLVRADSPLRFIHDIRGRTVNVGANGGSRALTVDSLYERMFGARPSAAQRNALPLAAAVASLLQNAGVDVIALVGGQPLGALAGLTADQASQLRLLKLDAGNAESRRALRTFLPGTVPAHALGAAGDVATPTFSVMSFLVATGSGANEARATGRVAQALCNALPRLKRDGHAKWREVQTGLTLPAGWPYAPAARQAFDACASPGAGPVAASAAARTALAGSAATLR